MLLWSVCRLQMIIVIINGAKVPSKISSVYFAFLFLNIGNQINTRFYFQFIHIFHEYKDISPFQNESLTYWTRLLRKTSTWLGKVKNRLSYSLSLFISKEKVVNIQEHYFLCHVKLLKRSNIPQFEPLILREMVTLLTRPKKKVTFPFRKGGRKI